MFKPLTLIAALVAATTSALSISSPSIPSHDASLRRQTSPLPSSFKWSSTGPLVGPKSDARNISAIKDPSIVSINGTYHVFASTAVATGYSLVYFNFTSFNAANASKFVYLKETNVGTGYRAAPEVFYFAPQKLWYLVYQNGNAAYSTNANINDPAGWTAPKNFYNGTPKTISDNIGDGYWVDMWVICDAANCHLFSSDDNGHLFRSQTTVANFPNGMSEPVIVLSDADKFRLYEASNVYRVADTGEYLLLVEALGSDGNRYFRSWTATSLTGNWTELAATEANPWARSNNVVFENGVAWTNSISHGEIVRTQVDQTLTISRCGWQYLYQGIDPKASGEYNALPWKLALLTQVGATC